MNEITLFAQESPHFDWVDVWGPIIVFLLFFGVLPCALLFLWFLISLKLATFRAAKKHLEETPFFFGIFRMVLWDNTEGIVIQCNGRITRVFKDCRGGRAIICPFVGDMVRCRLPTGLRLYRWKKANVPTRDSIKLRFTIAVEWKIGDIDKYLDTHHKSQPSETWIDSILEGEIRTLVAEIETSILIDQPGFVKQDQDESPRAHLSGRLREKLTSPLRVAVNERMRSKGLALETLEIQGLGFDPAIQAAIDSVWTAQAKPYVGRLEGMAEAEKVRALVEQVGQEGAIAILMAKQPGGALAMILKELIPHATSRLPDASTEASRDGRTTD